MNDGAFTASSLFLRHRGLAGRIYKDVSPRNTLGSLRWGTVFMSCQLASPAFATSTSPSQCGEIAG